MSVPYRLIGTLAGMALLAGCQMADDGFWRGRSGEEPAGAAEVEEAHDAVAPPAGSAPDLPTIDAAAYGGAGSVVSGKVRDIAGEIQALQAATRRNEAAYADRLSRAERNAQSYHATVAAIASRLQIGTTPGNPVLVSQYGIAQTRLDRLAADIGGFNTLGAAVASNAATAAYVSDAIDATLRLSGAVEEDHRQLLELRDANNRILVGVETAMSALNAAVERRTAHAHAERTRMAWLAGAIANGRLHGPALVEFGTQAAPSALSVGLSLAGRQPLAVIRFDRDDVEYRDALYRAVGAALERKPDAVFDLVAVAPAGGTSGEVALDSAAVKRNAEEVLRALNRMGLPADRVSLSATTSHDTAVNEVRVFVR